MFSIEGQHRGPPPLSHSMWGTDWPICLKFLTYTQAVALFRNHLGFLSPNDHRQILYKTVQRVWPFGI